MFSKWDLMEYLRIKGSMRYADITHAFGGDKKSYAICSVVNRLCERGLCYRFIIERKSTRWGTKENEIKINKHESRQHSGEIWIGLTKGAFRYLGSDPTTGINRTSFFQHPMAEFSRKYFMKSPFIVVKKD